MTKTQSIEQEAVSTLRMLEKKDPGLKRLLNKAYGYAVFPSVGKASLVVGGSYGKGAVFAKGKFIGYATIGQTTIGVQIGGDTFTEVIVFKDRKDFDNMKRGKLSFAADASAVLIKAGAAAARGFGNGTRAFVYGSGGMLVEAAIGGQKFNFKPAGAGQKEMSRGQEEQDEEQDNQQAEDSAHDESDEEGEEGEQSDEGEEQGTDLATRALGAARSTLSGVTNFVKEHPVAAGAIGVGVLAGGTILVMRWINSDQSEDQQDTQDDENDQDEDQSDDQQDDEQMSADNQDTDSDQDQPDQEEEEQSRSRGNGRRRRYANT